MGHASLRGPWPTITDVTVGDATPGEPARLRVTVGGEVPVDAVILHTAEKSNVPYDSVTLQKTGSGAWVGELPGVNKGRLRWYVEARAPKAGRAAFHPRRAEAAPNVRRNQ